MKWILIALVSLNLALFGFQYWSSTQEDGGTEETLSATLNNLELTASQQARFEQVGKSTPKKEPEKVLQCIRITGLKEGDSYSVVESRLAALEVSSEKRVVKQLSNTDYQVLLGPFVSQEEARTKLEEVKASGVESYVITSGQHANSLSLGVFSSLENANRRRDELFTMDISATVYENKRYIDAAILEIDAQSAALISDESISGMLSEFDGAKFIRFNCN
ncbi:SPOR domain-containing protein [Reinekea marinisedimentorum]|uniref:Sporulation related protein n=1 Tax=Reinekea marinisedimentorum TaxID=230495 RepID=A0A4R3I1C1_9GAMM|nr:SPOR domain-containing protein [Reinekea marinisedimentorum]TCS37649.1 hypothetical protein BCF53_1184 [Reinekea marinisedimentorum]